MLNNWTVVSLSLSRSDSQLLITMLNPAPIVRSTLTLGGKKSHARVLFVRSLDKICYPTQPSENGLGQRQFRLQ